MKKIYEKKKKKIQRVIKRRAYSIGFCAGEGWRRQQGTRKEKEKT